VSTRRWSRFPVDLPVHVVVRNGIESLKCLGAELNWAGVAWLSTQVLLSNPAIQSR